MRLWPYPRANGEHTIDVLAGCAPSIPIASWSCCGTAHSYHRAGAVREAAAALRIELMPLPGYSPDLMPVEALWRWLREDVTYHHCHASPDDLTRRVAAFQARINRRALRPRRPPLGQRPPRPRGGETQVLKLGAV